MGQALRASRQKRIFVGLSGGVDSSVAAALLKEQGYDVVAVFIKVWQADFLPCTWREERRDAMRAAARLDIPFVTLDLEKEYKKEVVDYMVREYGRGRVPNPDVMCNKHVKFGAFLEYAKANGADLIATGHYARIQSPVASHQFQVKNADSDPYAWKLATGNYKLLKGVDKEKDQSYFLWTLTQEQLAHILFPVGHLLKKDVRKLARKFGLPNAEKKDSQGLCFIGKVDMADFLRHYLPTKNGAVLDTEGKTIGTHKGALLFTIGQRHGFIVKRNLPGEEPYFVVAKDMQKNTITVAHRDPEKSQNGYRNIGLGMLNVISKKSADHRKQKILVRVRYRGSLLPATWRFGAHSGDEEAEIILKQNEEGIALGQSLVLYKNEECLGGGVIMRTSP
ncbi:MAG: tRNA 2-thiouridine(34) synthase MnmA [Candidatus Lloydbacteria bacterium RIFCSPLOWO2_01_FULL_50_20]|uniref:tRNA-specific 2-thiouridylase MnmA n=1 Tax=Candidatus Lloydbacteria bacterium RIFCSPLOWO2_01_FULL_50_20 TaxID=1798665 RepID=A0A1G2DCM6_9BACT|nr:MAG: tRNA 2-thiouridine(34) synthase MnmA [Candidatus Lloydbacteria bacterium RIFCSPLOWO2_01_FULL_50_20]